MHVSVIVGNPKARSRTLHAATLAAQRLSGRDPDSVFDLADFGEKLLQSDSAEVTEAITSVRESDCVIVASPTFKASYTGLLKLFLDRFPSRGLEGVIAFPLMIGATNDHAFAPEFLLKPVLVELGAICPTAGLFLIDKSYESDPRFEVWGAAARHFLSHWTARL